MGGVGGVGSRTEEKNYCAEESDETARVCTDSPKERDLVCDGTERPTLEAEIPRGEAAAAGPAAPGREADYWTLSVGIGAVVGAGVSATFDRHGHVYLGVSGGVSLSPTVTASLVSGHMVDNPSPSDSDLRQLLEGDALSASAGAVRGVGIMNSPGGTAIETGVYIPQAGAAFEHTWEVSSRGPRW